MWFWVWVLLVVGALAGAFFVGRHVWRAGVRLAREAGRAGELFGSAGDRISAAVDAAETARPDTSPTMFDDRAVLHARVAERRDARAGRRGARLERNRATWQVWTGSTWLDRRRAEKTVARR